MKFFSHPTRFVLLVGVIAICFATATTARAQTVLYGATGGVNPGSLYTINPANGAFTLVGALLDGSASAYSVTGLAYDPVNTLLYGATATNSPTGARELVLIDPSTALVTSIGAFGGSESIGDLTYRGGVLYGSGASTANLYSINVSTGAATSLGPSGVTGPAGVGIAADAGGTIFGTPNDANGDLVTYNIGNGSTVLAASLGGTPPYPTSGINALAFSPGGTLYGVNNNRLDVAHPADLITIDTATGAIADIGATIANLDSIVFITAVPEPTTYLAGALTAVALFISQRRRLFRLSRVRVCAR